MPALQGITDVTSDDGYVIRVQYDVSLVAPTRDPLHEKPGFTAAISRVVGEVRVANQTPGREVTFGMEAPRIGAGDSGPYSGLLVLEGIYDEAFCARLGAHEQGAWYRPENRCVMTMAEFPMSEGTTMQPWPTGEGRRLWMMGAVPTSNGDWSAYFPEVLNGNSAKEDGPTIFAGIPEATYDLDVHRLLHPIYFQLAFSRDPAGGSWHRKCRVIARSDGKPAC